MTIKRLFILSMHAKFCFRKPISSKAKNGVSGPDFENA